LEEEGKVLSKLFAYFVGNSITGEDRVFTSISDVLSRWEYVMGELREQISNSLRFNYSTNPMANLIDTWQGATIASLTEVDISGSTIVGQFRYLIEYPMKDGTGMDDLDPAFMTDLNLYEERYYHESK
jgi:hypothetical protein